MAAGIITEGVDISSGGVAISPGGVVISPGGVAVTTGGVVITTVGVSISEIVVVSINVWVGVTTKMQNKTVKCMLMDISSYLTLTSYSSQLLVAIVCNW